MRAPVRVLALALLLCIALQPLLAADPIETAFQQALPGARLGLVVTTMDGQELVAIAPDQRFIPGSNTKILTTAAAFANLGDLNVPDEVSGASIRLAHDRSGAPDVILVGHGDARLSSDPACTEDCLATLADAVAKATRAVRDVIGDDSFFPDQRWSPGMSWNNIPSRSGTGISALTLDDNEVLLIVTPAAPGNAPMIAAPLPYFEIDNRAITVMSGKTMLDIDRMPFSRTIRITGTIAADAQPEKLHLGIDDPADYAAWRLKALLQARGVRVGGNVGVRHRPLQTFDNPAQRGDAPAPRATEPLSLARVMPPPLFADMIHTNKVSQNLHAELLLRRVGRLRGTGSIADGVAAVEEVMAQAGIPRTGWDIADGSGMSSYNRLSPRNIASLLRWIAAQPWGAAWRETLPIAGVDGTLARRFRGTPLEGKLFAKTGTLNASAGLSGYMIAASGRTLIISAFANDVPADASAGKAIEGALLTVAAAN